MQTHTHTHTHIQTAVTLVHMRAERYSCMFENYNLLIIIVTAAITMLSITYSNLYLIVRRNVRAMKIKGLYRYNTFSFLREMQYAYCNLSYRYYMVATQVATILRLITIVCTDDS